MTRRTPPEHILWLDLETDGNKPSSNILEIGMAITDQNLQILNKPLEPRAVDISATFEATFRPKEIDITEIDPFVVEMHTKNGLWLEILNDDPRDAYTDYIALERDILLWINRWHPSTEHMALAGSGVLHFDRQYIRRYLPRLDKSLTYWGYDVGVIRRFLKDHVKSEPDTSYLEQPNHRALQDVIAAIQEYKAYRDWVADWTNWKQS